MVVFGVVTTPLGILGYTWLEKTITTPGIKGILIKLLIDQFWFAPTFNALYLFLTTWLQTNDTSKGVQAIKMYLWECMKLNWKIWPIIGIINFKFFDANMQIIVNNIVALFFGLFLSLIQGKSLSKNQQPKNENLKNKEN